MKISAIQKRKTIAKRILLGLATIMVIWGAILTSLALYLKINPVNITWLLNDLKTYGIVSPNVNVSNLSIGYNGAVVIVANDISMKDESFTASTNRAFVKISPTSLLHFSLIIKEIIASDTKVVIDATNIKTDDSNLNSNFNLKKIFKKLTQFLILKRTKVVKISNTDIDINFENSTKQLENINLKFVNTKNTFIFDAEGTLEISETKQTPIKIKMFVPEENKKIKVEASIKDIYIEDVLHMIFPSKDVVVSGNGEIDLFAEISKKYKVERIYGSTKAKNGFVNIEVYDNKLNFDELSADFLVGKDRKSIEITKGSIKNKNKIDAKFEGRLAMVDNVTNLDVKVTTPAITFDTAKTYIPDLEFKDWINENIKGGNLQDVSFEFHGPLSNTQMDGKEGRPYMNIISDFSDLSTSYYGELPPVTNAKGKFRLLKNSIDIDISSGLISKQKIRRGSVNISPLFSDKEDDAPDITIKALAAGEINDTLDQLNKQFDIYKNVPRLDNINGEHETQALVILYLKNIISDDKKAGPLYSLDIISDLRNVVGQDPIFKQPFQTSEGQVIIKDDDFKLIANGFTNNQPFQVTLTDKLNNFGSATFLDIEGTLENTLIKDLFTTNGLSLSGTSRIDGTIQRNKDQWNFNLESNVTDSLIKYEMLDYTKPLHIEGIVKSSGVVNLAKNQLDINNIDINIDNFKAKGFAKVNLQDFTKSNINIKNLKIKNKTDVDLISLKNKNLSVKGKKLAFNFFKLLESDSNKKESQKGSGLNKIDIKLDSVALNKAEPIYNVNVDLDLSNLIKGMIKARNRQEQQDFYAKFTPINQTTVTVDSLLPNFGNTLKNTINVNNINDGLGILKGNLYFKQQKFDYAELTFEVKKFQLLEAPTLAQILASISLQQLLSGKKGILFDDMTSKLFYSNQILKIKKLKANGPAIGIMGSGKVDFKNSHLDLKGTLVPFVALNSLISNVPVLGYILTGSQKAISGTDFKVHGSFDDPKVSVSPLSTITPGLIKDIFGH